MVFTTLEFKIAAFQDQGGDKIRRNFSFMVAKKCFNLKRKN